LLFSFFIVRVVQSSPPSFPQSERMGSRRIFARCERVRAFLPYTSVRVVDFLLFSQELTRNQRHSRRLFSFRWKSRMAVFSSSDLGLTNVSPFGWPPRPHRSPLLFSLEWRYAFFSLFFFFFFFFSFFPPFKQEGVCPESIASSPVSCRVSSFRRV